MSNPSSIELCLPGGRRVQISAVYLTPERASELLRANTGNRSIRTQLVADMVDDIRAGEWEFNGDTIKVADGPLLLDAQHRLTAISQAGIAVPAIIIEGLDPIVADTIDQIRPRSAADILRMRYGRQVKQENDLIAIATLLMVGRNGANRHPKRADIAAYADENYETLNHWAGWASHTARSSQRVSAPGMRTTYAALATGPLGALAIHMVDEGANEELVKDFFARISSGIVSETDSTNIIQAIRKRQHGGICLNRTSMGGSATSQAAMWTEYATYITAYNRWVTGEQVSIIKGQKEAVKRLSDLPTVSRIGA